MVCVTNKSAKCDMTPEESDAVPSVIVGAVNVPDTIADVEKFVLVRESTGEPLIQVSTLVEAIFKLLLRAFNLPSLL